MHDLRFFFTLTKISLLGYDTVLMGK